MIYLKVPYNKPIHRAMVKKIGGTWNNFIGLWEVDGVKSEQDINRKLRKYIAFNDDDLSTYRNNIAARCKPKSQYETLSIQETKFLQAYMKRCGDSKQAAIDIGCKPERGSAMAKRVMAKPVAQQWLAAEVEKLSVEARWTFEEKSRMLKQIAIAAVPVTAKSIEDMVPNFAISSIAEHNKMQGDYSAEKRVNVNVEVDIEMEEAKRLAQELLEKNKRDY